MPVLTLIKARVKFAGREWTPAAWWIPVCVALAGQRGKGEAAPPTLQANRAARLHRRGRRKEEGGRSNEDLLAVSIGRRTHPWASDGGHGRPPEQAPDQRRRAPRSRLLRGAANQALPSPPGPPRPGHPQRRPPSPPTTNQPVPRRLFETNFHLSSGRPMVDCRWSPPPLTYPPRVLSPSGKLSLT